MKNIIIFTFLFLFGINNVLGAECFKGLAFRFSKFLGRDLLEVVQINLGVEEDSQQGATNVINDVVERRVLRELKLVDMAQRKGEFSTQKLRIKWERQLYFAYGKHFNLVYEVDGANRVELVGDIVNTNGVYACHVKYSQILTKNGRDYVFGYCGSVNSDIHGDYELKCGRWGHYGEK